MSIALCADIKDIKDNDVPSTRFPLINYRKLKGLSCCVSCEVNEKAVVASECHIVYNNFPLTFVSKRRFHVKLRQKMVLIESRSWRAKKWRRLEIKGNFRGYVKGKYCVHFNCIFFHNRRGIKEKSLMKRKRMEWMEYSFSYRQSGKSTFHFHFVSRIKDTPRRDGRDDSILITRGLHKAEMSSDGMGKVHKRFCRSVVAICLMVDRGGSTEAKIWWHSDFL